MKISTKGRYALRMLLDIASHSPQGYVALKDVSCRQEISKKYLEQIVPPLTHAGFIEALRGFKGGYRLLRKPEDISLGEVLRVTEGGLAPVVCLEGEVNTCKRSAECAMLNIWKGLSDVISNYLDSITLADILNNCADNSADNYYI